MPSVEVYADISVQEFYDSCYSHHIKELVQLLEDNDEITGMNIESCELQESLIKISKSEIQLTVDESELIKSIAKRLV